jgi:translation initiation factor 3 subunit A
MAAKDADEGAPAAPDAQPTPSAAPAAAAAPASDAAPAQRSGYVPPHLRGAGGAAPGGGWREREAAVRETPARAESGSPAAGGRYEAPRRGFGEERKASPATGGRWEPPARRGPPAGEQREPESRAPPAASSGEKYVPRWKRAGQ